MAIFEPNNSDNWLMLYNWQQKDWPDFKYNLQKTEELLFAFAVETAHVSGSLNAMPESMQLETLLNTMVAEAIKTSEIEGEYLSRPDVASSIRNNLGINIVPEKVKDKKAQGIGALMVDVRKTYSDLLTAEKLFEWHKMLLSGDTRVNAGIWRFHEAPMQVVSGSIGNEVIHFEAPPAVTVKTEMDRFIKWFNDTAPGGKNEIKKAPVRSAIAHLYFESIHPFEDGNGRIGRAIAEKALSQTMERPILMSLSRSIEANRKAYYKALEEGQRSNDVTEWVYYFSETILNAQLQAKQLIAFTLHKANFFDRFKASLNERQMKAIKKMLDTGPDGFDGGMTAKKYMSITKVSKATATRDLQNLADIKALIPTGGGRSIHYTLNIN